MKYQNNVCMIVFLDWLVCMSWVISWGRLTITTVNRRMYYFQRQQRENNGAGRQRLCVMEMLREPHVIYHQPTIAEEKQDTSLSILTQINFYFFCIQVSNLQTLTCLSKCFLRLLPANFRFSSVWPDTGMSGSQLWTQIVWIEIEKVDLFPVRKTKRELFSH